MLGGATTWIGKFASAIAAPAQQGAQVPHFKLPLKWGPPAFHCAVLSLGEFTDPDSKV